jgi:hypothetical protein
MEGQPLVETTHTGATSTFSPGSSPGTLVSPWRDLKARPLGRLGGLVQFVHAEGGKVEHRGTAQAPSASGELDAPAPHRALGL